MTLRDRIERILEEMGVGWACDTPAASGKRAWTRAQLATDLAAALEKEGVRGPVELELKPGDKVWDGRVVSVGVFERSDKLVAGVDFGTEPPLGVFVADTPRDEPQPSVAVMTDFIKKAADHIVLAFKETADRIAAAVKTRPDLFPLVRLPDPQPTAVVEGTK